MTECPLPVIEPNVHSFILLPSEAVSSAKSFARTNDENILHADTRHRQHLHPIG